MKKHTMRGWRDVFAFTFRQTIGKAWKVVTILVAVLILAAAIVINLFMARPDEDEAESASEKSEIRQVLLLDESGLEPMDFRAQLDDMQDRYHRDVEFTYVEPQSQEAVIKMAQQKERAVVVFINAQYELRAVLPNESPVGEDDAWTLLESLASCFETGKLLQTGLSQEQLALVLLPTSVSVMKIGEETSVGVELIRFIGPMLFGLILYFLLLMYGQSVSQEVSTEKTSKLMETLLTSVHPYALLTGKVLAIVSVALSQFLIWVAALVAGLYGGNFIAQQYNPEYENSVVAIVRFLRDNIGESALSLPAILLALLIFCTGFLFYAILAGLSGSMVSRPEEISNTQGIFVFPMVISWLVSYFATMMENEALMTAARYIPFTSPFSLPIELITGVTPLWEGLLSFAILFVFSTLVIMLSARIYRGMVLYNGQGLSLKTIRNVIRN